MEFEFKSKDIKVSRTTSVSPNGEESTEVETEFEFENGNGLFGCGGSLYAGNKKIGVKLENDYAAKSWWWGIEYKHTIEGNLDYDFETGVNHHIHYTTATPEYWGCTGYYRWKWCR